MASIAKGAAAAAAAAAALLPQQQDSGAASRPGQRSNSQRMKAPSSRWSMRNLLRATFFTSLLPTASSVFLDFDNCLSPGIIASKPVQLQWIPLFVDVRFDRFSSSNALNITYYGNVTGEQFNNTLPPYTDVAYWNNNSQVNGKIIDLPTQTNTYSTLSQRYAYLSYVAYQPPNSRFCNSTSDGTTCPIGPAFNVSPTDFQLLRAFSVSNDLNSTFAFTSIDATISFQSGYKYDNGDGIPLGCISTIVTPELGPTIGNLLMYLPIVVLVFVAAAVWIASTLSPWGTTDVFRWTSNWGRDQDILRLVTPGFGDCLQYIQFIVLAGSLSLSYPGYFQPAVSKVAWSTLMFNQSFVSNNASTINPIDGVYATHGKFGLERMSQLVGFAGVSDIWAGTVIWTLVILAIVIVVCQLAFFVRWLLQLANKTPAEDLQSKNWPFTGGNMIRVVCNYFLLPIVSFSMFQFVIASRTPIYLTALAAVLMVLLLAFAGLLLKVILTIKPRGKLFDDLPTVLLYGPLYNTYSDNEAPFALIPALLTFIRGIAIGAVQPSGVAQLVILAICEVVLILTLLAFRPFHQPTSMNAYHIFFASFRLAILLLSVAFVPSLGVSEGPKGWIGYIILALHGVVLVFGFLTNACQRLIEVFARIAGFGDDEGGSAKRGGLAKVFGVRQLHRRARRPQLHRSINSDAIMLTDEKSFSQSQYGSRSRSLSASSGFILNHRFTSSDVRSTSTHLDRLSSHDIMDDHNTFTSTGEVAPFDAVYPEDSFSRGGPGPAYTNGGPQDRYYRAPRQRRATGETLLSGARSRGATDATGLSISPEPGPSDRALSTSPEGTLQHVPSPAFLRDREPSDSDRRRNDVDYAVREVDFYYGVRGPALNHQSTRKLKTGPADPVGPVVTATGWFRNFLNRKTKDNSKGFEVVRSTRAPPEASYPEHVSSSPPRDFQDSSTAQPAVLGRAGSPAGGAGIPGAKTRSSHDSHSVVGSLVEDRELESREGVPKIGNMDFGSFEVPTRFPSQHSVRGPGNAAATLAPGVPRRSSKRRSVSSEKAILGGTSQRLSTVVDSPIRTASPVASTRVPFSESARRSVGTDLVMALSPEEEPSEGIDIDEHEQVNRHQQSEAFRLSQAGPNWPMGLGSASNGGPGPAVQDFGSHAPAHQHTRSISSSAASSADIAAAVAYNARLPGAPTVNPADPGLRDGAISQNTVHSYKISDGIRDASGFSGDGVRAVVERGSVVDRDSVMQRNSRLLEPRLEGILEGESTPEGKGKQREHA